jgi:hypothetical protein
VPLAADPAAAAALVLGMSAAPTTKAPLVVPPGLAPTPAAASVALAAMGLVAPFPGLPGVGAGATGSAGAAPLGLGMGVLDAAGRVVGLGGEPAATGPGLGVGSSSSSKAAPALEMPAELRLKDGLEQKKRRLEVRGGWLPASAPSRVYHLQCAGVTGAALSCVCWLLHARPGTRCYGLGPTMTG